MTTHADVTEAAKRVVVRLLDDYSSADDFHSRPGGKSDPFRQATVKLGLKAKDFTGKRKEKLGTKCDDDDKDCTDAINVPKPRFKLKFKESCMPPMPRKVKQESRVIKLLKVLDRPRINDKP